jgi:hypothetical protein
MNMHVKSRFVAVAAGLLCTGILLGTPASAQRKKKKQSEAAAAAAAKDTTVKPPMIPPQGTPKANPKQFGELIPAKSKADSGLFNI